MMYDREWYEKNLELSMDSYREIAEEIKKVFSQYSSSERPSMVDFGCGLNGLLNLIDYASYKVGIDKHNFIEENFVQADLSKPLHLARRFDIAICLETIEHISPEYEDTVMDNITSASDFIIFSGATPGQGGDGHINERPPEYWEEKFRKLGYRKFDVIRKDLVNSLPWYKNNTYVYIRYLAIIFWFTEDAVLKYRDRFEFMEKLRLRYPIHYEITTVNSDYSPSDVLRRYWGKGLDIILIDQDMEFTEEQLRSLIACEEKRCIYYYHPRGASDGYVTLWNEKGRFYTEDEASKMQLAERTASGFMKISASEQARDMKRFTVRTKWNGGEGIDNAIMSNLNYPKWHVHGKVGHI